jgi:hypothetical protein
MEARELNSSFYSELLTHLESDLEVRRQKCLRRNGKLNLMT